METNIQNIKDRLKYLISIIDEGNLDEEFFSSISNELKDIKEELNSLSKNSL